MVYKKKMKRNLSREGWHKKMSIKTLIFDYTFQIVAIGAALLGMISGVMGTFATLRKQSLLGDGVSHSALPGVVLAFLLTGSKNTEVLLLGTLIAGFMATGCIVTITRNSRIKFDGALALVMSVFFGLGLVLLTYVQKIPNSNQAGLNKFIYGQASALLQRDVFIMSVCGVVLFALVLLFWKELKCFSFDEDFAKSIGLPIAKLNILLSFMIVVAVIVGIQTVGVILMSAMLISPSVAARQWTNKLSIMVILSASFGLISGVCGTAISSLVTKMPTGPIIVVCMSVIVIISILFAPQRGVIARMIQRHKNKQMYHKGGGNCASIH